VKVQTVLPTPQAITATPIEAQAMRSRATTTARTTHAAPAASTTLL
jgi:hypothetical protein